MSTDPTFSESDEGKTVIDADGEKIGTVSEVRGSTAHVDPDTGISDSIMSMLGWTGSDEDEYRIHSESIARITDDEVHLRRDL
ncbi:MAG: PRC-barrel domain-containing protein [archaeon]